MAEAYTAERLIIKLIWDEGLELLNTSRGGTGAIVDRYECELSSDVLEILNTLKQKAIPILKIEKERQEEVRKRHAAQIKLSTRKAYHDIIDKVAANHQISKTGNLVAELKVHYDEQILQKDAFAITNFWSVFDSIDNYVAEYKRNTLSLIHLKQATYQT